MGRCPERAWRGVWRGVWRGMSVQLGMPVSAVRGAWDGAMGKLGKGAEGR